MAHPVTLSLSIVQAIEPPSKPLPFYETTRNNSRKRIYESVNPLNYFHLEYQLTPDCANETYKTDVVTYGIVAKVYTKQDERVVNTWLEDGLTYYGWKHSHKISLSLDSLLDLYNHTLTFQLWNSKEKVSARAKYDRPKAFRLPVPDDINTPCRPAHLPGVYHNLSQQTRRRINRKRSEVIESEGESYESLVSPQKSLKIPPSIKEDDHVLQQPSSADPTPQASDESLKPPNILESQTFFLSSSPGLKGIPKHHLKKLQDFNKGRIDKAAITLSIKLSDLFDSRDKVTVSTCTKDSGNEIKHCEITLQMETPLMSDWQRRSLNPMTVTIMDCSSMPPISSYKKERYKPVFISYQFHDKPKVFTNRLPYSRNLVWNYSTVLLLGTIKPELLLEYLRGPPLIFEIHDREEEDENGTNDNVVFGQRKTDAILGNCNYGKIAEFKNKHSFVSEAKLDLSCLLSGLTKMEFVLPIQSVTASEKLSQTDGQDFSFFGSQLSVIIELSYPLIFSPLSINEDLLSQRPLTPFGRFLYIISTENKFLVQKVLALLNEINTNALNLKELPLSARSATLSTYKLTYDQISSNQCDVVTGFHIEDTKKHIFVLEGLHWKGLQKVWKEVPHHTSEDSSVIKSFYNSDYTFSSRLYGTLDVDLIHIILPQPLEKIVQDPTLYTSIPYQCFIMLLNLQQLPITEDFGSIVHNNMYPTVDTITSLSLLCSQNTLSSRNCSVSKPTQLIASEKFSGEAVNRRRSRSWEPLNNTNSQYEMLIKQRQSTPPTNKIIHNISRVHLLSQQLNNNKKQRRRSSSVGNNDACVYSSQTYNSIELGMSAMRKQLDSRSRFTYCQSYHSMTIEPVDAKEELKKYYLREDKNMWRTKKGFVFPGVKTALESNIHSKKPDTARVEELEMDFTDNELHSNTMKATVDWLHYSWKNRAFDFERYASPPLCFGANYPVTIHLAGESLEKEMNDKKSEDQKQWESKVIVKDKRFYTFRQGSRTELTTKGPLAARQQDKLKGLLKDQPMMTPLASYESLRVDTIPSLSVIHNEDKEMSIAGYIPRAGPDESQGSLKRDCNTIPIPKTVPCTNVYPKKLFVL